MASGLDGLFPFIRILERWWRDSLAHFGINVLDNQNLPVEFTREPYHCQPIVTVCEVVENNYAEVIQIL